MKAFLLKVDSDVYTLWSSYAKKRGISLSEWIRRQCNAGGEEDQWRPDAATVARVDAEMAKRFPEDVEDHPAKDMRRVGTVPAPERRAGVARGVSAPRATAEKAREIKLCRHNLSDCTICGTA